MITREQWAEYLPDHRYTPPCDEAQPAQSSTAADRSGSELVAAHSGKCVGPKTDTPAAPIHQFRCKGLLAVRWTFTRSGNAYRIRNSVTGLCLDGQPAEHKVGDASAVVQRPCADVASQLWQLRVLSSRDGFSEAQLVEQHSGHCLDINGGLSTDGTHAIRWPCGQASSNQTFRIEESALR